MTPNTVSPGDIEFACPACGQHSAQNFDRLEADASFVCEGCGTTARLGNDDIAKAIKAGQRALNATIRGIKKGSK
jgi:transcription elongation factor Elf1